jgi:hypothetical protein
MDHPKMRRQRARRRGGLRVARRVIRSVRLVVSLLSAVSGRRWAEVALGAVGAGMFWNIYDVLRWL